MVGNLETFQSLRAIIRNRLISSDKTGKETADICQALSDYFIGSLAAVVDEKEWKKSIRIALTCLKEYQKVEIDLKGLLEEE